MDRKTATGAVGAIAAVAAAAIITTAGGAPKGWFVAVDQDGVMLQADGEVLVFPPEAKVVDHDGLPAVKLPRGDRTDIWSTQADSLTLVQIEPAQECYPWRYAVRVEVVYTREENGGEVSKVRAEETKASRKARRRGQ